MKREIDSDKDNLMTGAIFSQMPCLSGFERTSLIIGLWTNLSSLGDEIGSETQTTPGFDRL